MIISFLKSMQRKSGQAGATLIAVIVTMLVMAVIGAAIYSLTYTAALNQVVAQRAAKAFYLAESGLRIAASEYKAAAAADKNATMVALHGKIFTMPDTVSTIEISVYPYWLYADAATASTLYLPGGAPPIDDTGTTPITFPAPGLLRIKDVGRTPVWEGSKKAEYSNVNISSSFDADKGTMVTFTFSTPFSDPIIPGDEFYVGYSYTYTAAADVNPGGNLVLNIDNDNQGTMFPPQRGIILVVSSTVSQYTYDTRTVNTSPSPHQVTFTNIRAVPGESAVWPLAIITGREIYVGKSVGFRSAAEYGD